MSRQYPDPDTDRMRIADALERIADVVERIAADLTTTPPAAADTRPLPEDVNGHAMGPLFTHHDERTCAYHPRLHLWVIDSVTECLRRHPPPESLQNRPSTGRPTP